MYTIHISQHVHVICQLTISVHDNIAIVLQHRKERMVYHKHIQKARANPEKYVTVIIDGMDQKKTSIPFLPRESKSAQVRCGTMEYNNAIGVNTYVFMYTFLSYQGLWRLRTHLTGAIIHTGNYQHGKQVYAFVDTLQWPHDSNLAINVLEEVLSRLETKHGHLPEVLYIQMDNCFRENKNRYTFAYCALLVELKVFRKVRRVNVYMHVKFQYGHHLFHILHRTIMQIRINFLQVGHTHADCDQFFSKISQHMLKHGAESLQGGWHLLPL